MAKRIRVIFSRYVFWSKAQKGFKAKNARFIRILEETKKVTFHDTAHSGHFLEVRKEYEVERMPYQVFLTLLDMGFHEGLYFLKRNVGLTITPKVGIQMDDDGGSIWGFVYPDILWNVHIGNLGVQSDIWGIRVSIKDSDESFWMYWKPQDEMYQDDIIGKLPTKFLSAVYPEVIEDENSDVVDGDNFSITEFRELIDKLTLWALRNCIGYWNPLE